MRPSGVNYYSSGENGECVVKGFKRKSINMYVLECERCTTRSVVLKEKWWTFKGWTVVFRGAGMTRTSILPALNRTAAFSHAAELHKAYRLGQKRRGGCTQDLVTS